jgi:hypothetical protein
LGPLPNHPSPNHPVQTESDKIVPKHLVILLPLLGTLCLLALAFYLYLGAGRRISVGHFELERAGGQWSWQTSRVVAFSPSGSTLCDFYCLGPFRVTHCRDLRAR